MPELPEVETTRRGLITPLIDQTVGSLWTSGKRLRWMPPDDLAGILCDQTLLTIDRRSKYLLFRFPVGCLMVHLGMSGSLRLDKADTPYRQHDHLALGFSAQSLRLHDPRRFGGALWTQDDPARHPLLRALGPEPLADTFTASHLHHALRRRAIPIKVALMTPQIVVGVGNIYASESLFHAGIDPRTPAQCIDPIRLERLVNAVRNTLKAALQAGGSSLRDYVSANGEPGYFQLHTRVYDRSGQPCHHCGTTIRSLRLAGRNTFYCPKCQR